jgi:anthranilate phosphoribosyltransferase
MIREAIGKLVSGQNLDSDEAALAMAEIMDGEASGAQIGAFVTALRMKGESVAEIAGLARVMRDRATHVEHDAPALDTCGTGGDGAKSFNISTTAAFVAAGAGVVVAKHGNRAMSSQCGSADVLEALGVKLELGPDGVAKCLREVGIGFMFAPLFHPAMKHAGPPRREIGIRTVFNILGPLTNPARAEMQLLGVADANIARKMGDVLQMLGSRHAVVVHGLDGLDELTTTGPSLLIDVRPEGIFEQEVNPTDLGLASAQPTDISGGNAEQNAAYTRAILAGEPGPRRDIVLLNAAAALYAADVVSGLVEGLDLARKSIDGGLAQRKLDKLIAVSNEV